MVGWSYGGAIVRVFSGNFPGVVSGLILVDPSPEDFYARASREFPDLMAQEEESYLPTLYTDSMRRAEQRETAGYSSSMEQARASDDNHSTPTILLIAGRHSQGAPDPLSRLWIDELERWGARRPNTESRVVAGAGHHIAKDKPEAVVGGVRELLNRAPTDRS